MIPRIPYEDYKRLKLLQGLAEQIHVAMPHTAQMIARFEQRLQAFIEAQGADQFHPDLFTDRTSDEVATIFRELEKCQ